MQIPALKDNYLKNTVIKRGKEGYLQNVFSEFSEQKRRKLKFNHHTFIRDKLRTPIGKESLNAEVVAV